MDDQPDDPRRESREPDPADVGDGGVPADRGERARVAVAELQRGLAGDAPPDVLGRRLGHLDRDRRHHGKRASGDFEVGGVADHVDVRMTRHVEGWRHGHPALLRRRQSEPAGEGHGFHARRPDER